MSARFVLFCVSRCLMFSFCFLLIAYFCRFLWGSCCKYGVLASLWWVIFWLDGLSWKKSFRSACMDQIHRLLFLWFILLPRRVLLPVLLVGADLGCLELLIFPSFTRFCRMVVFDSLGIVVFLAGQPMQRSQSLWRMKLELLKFSSSCSHQRAHLGLLRQPKSSSSALRQRRRLRWQPQQKATRKHMSYNATSPLLLRLSDHRYVPSRICNLPCTTYVWIFLANVIT